MALSALRDGNAAEEVAQESIARVVQALRDGRLRHLASLGAFARAIAQHVIVDTRRSQGRLVPLAGDETGTAAPGCDALANLVSAEETARLTAGLETLSASDREILHLSFYEGLTPRELARRLGQPGARLRKRKQRALQRLRLLLQSRGHESGRRPTQVQEVDDR